VKLPNADVLAKQISAERTGDPALPQVFPYVSVFDTVYRVRFPRVDPPLAGRAFVLEIASTLGQLKLDFGAPAKPFDLPKQAP
jgi:hypothetical protein